MCTWRGADDSVRMLRYALAAEDVDRLVLTRRWAIAAMAPPVHPRTVDTEIDDRKADLGEVLDWVFPYSARVYSSADERPRPVG